MNAKVYSAFFRADARRTSRPWQELIVDSFAGGGGASLGIELATGRAVDAAPVGAEVVEKDEAGAEKEEGWR